MYLYKLSLRSAVPQALALKDRLFQQWLLLSCSVKLSIPIKSLWFMLLKSFHISLNKWTFLKGYLFIRRNIITLPFNWKSEMSVRRLVWYVRKKRTNGSGKGRGYRWGNTWRIEEVNEIHGQMSKRIWGKWIAWSSFDQRSRRIGWACRWNISEWDRWNSREYWI